MFGEAAASSDGGAASAGEVVAVGASDAFDDAELAQTGELSGEGGGRALGEQRPEVGAVQAGDVEAGTPQHAPAVFDKSEAERWWTAAAFSAERSRPQDTGG